MRGATNMGAYVDWRRAMGARRFDDGVPEHASLLLQDNLDPCFRMDDLWRRLPSGQSLHHGQHGMRDYMTKQTCYSVRPSW